MRRKNKPIPDLTMAQVAYFWARVAKRKESDCWPWTRGRKSGYGEVSFNGAMYVATRVAYKLFYKIDPGPKMVCHKCDNPPCCNPHHFFLGFSRDNTKDRDRKGRQIAHRGEKNGNSRLTEDIVRAIRARYAAGGVTLLALSKEFPVCRKSITMIVRHKTWAHVEEVKP